MYFSRKIVRIGLGILFTFSILFTEVKGQDAHFSQFEQTPFVVNPALTGIFKGSTKVYLNYRNQWSSFGNAFRTMALSAETKFFERRRWHGSYVGGGLNIYRDVAGDGNLSTTKINLSGSGIIHFSSQTSLSAGIQGGLNQYSISSENLKWDDQYDGTGYNQDYGIPESLSGSQLYVGDVSAGVAYNYRLRRASLLSSRENGFSVGLALYHINKPRGDLFEYVKDRKYFRYSFFTKGVFPVASEISLIPSFLMLNQGPSTEYNVGAQLRFNLHMVSKYTGAFTETALYVGTYYRYRDAIIPSISFEKNHWQIAMSYDVNVSRLRTASNGRGGFEVAIIMSLGGSTKPGGSMKY